MKFNKIMVSGNATKDVEVKDISSNTVYKFGLAINNSYKKNGEWVDKVCFIDVYSFSKYPIIVRKGDNVFVEGILEQDTFIDKNGNNRSIHKIKALSIKNLSNNNNVKSNDNSIYEMDSIPF